MDESGNQDSGNNSRQVSWIIPHLPHPRLSLASDLAGAVYAVYSVAHFSGLSQYVDVLGPGTSDFAGTSVKENEIATTPLLKKASVPMYVNQSNPLAHVGASSCAVQLALAAVTQSPQSCCLCGSAVAVAAVAGGAVGCSGAAPQYESVWRQTPAS